MSRKTVILIVVLCLFVFIYRVDSHEEDSCGGIVCRNQGTCYFDNDEPKCQCGVGFSGTLCQTALRLHEYTVTYGDIATLKCEVEKSPTPSAITWHRVQDNSTTEVNKTNPLKISGGTIQHADLKIYLADFNDIGVYKCTAEYPDASNQTSVMKLHVTGVQIDCKPRDENRVGLLYNGIAKEVVFVNSVGKECPFTATDNDAMNEFTIDVKLRDESNESDDCVMSRSSQYLEFSSRVLVRKEMAGLEITGDLHFDVRCSYTITTESRVTVQAQSATVSKPIVLSQPQGPKAESTFKVDLRSWQGTALVRPKLGSLVRFRAVMTPAGDDKAFTVSSCQVFSDDKKKEMTILAEGCGTGWPFKKTKGFQIDGFTALSPIFKLFRIKRGSKLNIKCNFFVCKENCDGSSCKS